MSEWLKEHAWKANPPTRTVMPKDLFAPVSTDPDTAARVGGNVAGQVLAAARMPLRIGLWAGRACCISTWLRPEADRESLRGQSMNVRADLDRNDDALLRALREGDERVFSDLVDRWSHMMLRLALSRVESRAVAEEVVQDAWLTVYARSTVTKVAPRCGLGSSVSSSIWRVRGPAPSGVKSHSRPSLRRLSIRRGFCRLLTHGGLAIGPPSPRHGGRRRTNSWPERPARSSSRRSTHCPPRSVTSSSCGMSRACHPATSVTFLRSQTPIS